MESERMKLIREKVIFCPLLPHEKISKLFQVLERARPLYGLVSRRFLYSVNTVEKFGDNAESNPIIHLVCSWRIKEKQIDTGTLKEGGEEKRRK